MKKLIKILVIIIILLVIFLTTYSFIFKDERNNPNEVEDFNAQKDDVENLHQELQSEIDKINGIEDLDTDDNDDNYDDKMDKLDDMAKEASNIRDDKLGEDTLKSSGIKYQGDPCKESCW